MIDIRTVVTVSIFFQCLIMGTVNGPGLQDGCETLGSVPDADSKRGNVAGIVRGVGSFGFDRYLESFNVSTIGTGGLVLLTDASHDFKLAAVALKLI